MIEIPLSNDPSQSFSIQINDNFYNFRIKNTLSFMVVSIARNDTQLISNSRAMAGFQLIPYRYLENGEGNFAFITENNEYPFYTQFEKNQYLFYLSNDELELIGANRS